MTVGEPIDQSVVYGAGIAVLRRGICPASTHST